jgi:hypothetical protein
VVFVLDSKYDFGFLRRELHHFVAMAPGALERVKTPALQALRKGGDSIKVEQDFLVKRYQRFYKGPGWVGCAPKDPKAPVVFFREQLHSNCQLIDQSHPNLAAQAHPT